MEVTFQHPMGSSLIARLDPKLTAKEVIRRLEEVEFIPNGEFYSLCTRERVIQSDEILSNLVDENVRILRIVPNTCAG